MVQSLLAAADAADDESALVCTAGAERDDLAVPRFGLPLLARRPHRMPSAAWAVARAVLEWRPDVVHVHNPAMAAVAAPATWRGRRPRALVSVHGVADCDYPTASQILRLAGLPVVACGAGIAAALRGHGVQVYATVANGVGPPTPAADRSALLRRWGLDDHYRLVVSVGRLVAQKNHLLAIRALAEVPGAALAILGEGPMRAQLDEAILEMGMARRVVIDGTWTDARPVVAAADAMVLPSRWEGMPLVALEALAARTPLVATEVRGVRELLSNGIDALLVPTEDFRALAGALHRLLSDRELHTRLCDAGALLASRHGEAAMVAAYWHLYATVRGRQLARPTTDSQLGRQQRTIQVDVVVNDMLPVVPGRRLPASRAHRGAQLGRGDEGREPDADALSVPPHEPAVVAVDEQILDAAHAGREERQSGGRSLERHQWTGFVSAGEYEHVGSRVVSPRFRRPAHEVHPLLRPSRPGHVAVPSFVARTDHEQLAVRGLCDSLDCEAKPLRVPGTPNEDSDQSTREDGELVPDLLSHQLIRSVQREIHPVGDHLNAVRDLGKEILELADHPPRDSHEVAGAPLRVVPALRPPTHPLSDGAIEAPDDRRPDRPPSGCGVTVKGAVALMHGAEVGAIGDQRTCRVQYADTVARDEPRRSGEEKGKRQGERSGRATDADPSQLRVGRQLAASTDYCHLVTSPQQPGDEHRQLSLHPADRSDVVGDDGDLQRADRISTVDGVERPLGGRRGRRAVGCHGDTSPTHSFCHRR